MTMRPGGGGRGSYKFDGCGLVGLSEADLPFDVEPFEVNHSIYGALAYTLQGNGGSVAYTGDFRIGDNAKEMPDFIKEAKNAAVLIIEGTRTGREGDVEDQIAAEETDDEIIGAVGDKIQSDQFLDVERLASQFGCEFVNVETHLIEMRRRFGDGRDGHDADADHVPAPLPCGRHGKVPPDRTAISATAAMASTIRRAAPPERYGVRIR